MSKASASAGDLLVVYDFVPPLVSTNLITFPLVSNALFTGVYLADVLDYVKPTKGAQHVVFGGGDSLPNGPYGTSEAMHLAHDRKKGMLIAWAMNGLPLEPDHGVSIYHQLSACRHLT